MQRTATLLLAVALVAAACAERAPAPPVEVVDALDGREPVVRVRLRSLEGAAVFTIEGKGGLRVAAPPRPAVLHRGPFRLERDGPARHLVLEPLEGVFTIDARHTYAGRLEFTGGMLVNRVTLENYVLGVLRGELPLPDVPRAAAGAQAIAARSYTLHYLRENAAGHYDVDDTTLFQRYVGLHYAPDDGALRAGVRATAGLYLSWHAFPLKAYYHSTCGGHTTDVPTGLQREDVAPMRGVSCEDCRASRYWRWQVTLTDEEILKAAGAEGPLHSLAVEAKGPGDRAAVIRVEASGVSRIPASAFRRAIGPSRLRSTRLLGLERVDGGYRVEGAGWGHGVGLCQMGAIGKARAGLSAREIVSRYYPGATIRRAY